MNWKSITFKVAAPLIFYALVIHTATLYRVQYYSDKRIERQLQYRAELIAHAIEQFSGITGKSTEVTRFVQSLAAEADIESITIFSAEDERVLFASKQEWIGKTIKEIDSSALNRIAQEPNRSKAFIHSEDTTYDAYYHMEETELRNPGEIEHQRARVVVEVDGQNIALSQMKNRWVVYSIVTARVLGFLLLATFLFRRYLLKPIYSIIDAIESRSNGNEKAYAKVLSGDELGKVAGTFNDLVDQHGRQKRELEESNRELEEFAHVVSHDLKAPLRGIHNYSTFLEEDEGPKLSKEGKRQIATIKRLTKTMDALLDSLLHTSQVGRAAINRKPVAITSVAEEARDLLQPIMEESRATLQIRDPLPVLECDETRVREVLVNMISNAIKYNDKEYPEVVIGCEGDTIFVRDNGIGIKKQHQSKVFDMFKRLHRKDAYGGGTGSGLAIVKKIIDRHEGEIWLQSEPEKGTTFYFTFGKKSAVGRTRTGTS